jgi:hypothetical protein
MSPRVVVEEDTPLEEEEIPEPIDREVPEPELGEFPEQYPDDDRKNAGSPEITEPDTDALLEKYGKEYDDDAMLATSRSPRSPSPGYRNAGGPAGTPALRKRGIGTPADEGSWVSPDKPEPVQRPQKTMLIIGGALVLILGIAAIVLFGFPSLFGSNLEGTNVTPEPGPTIMGTLPATPVVTTVAPPSSGALVPLPTQDLPTTRKLYFHVRKDPITAKISIIFAGSAGEGSISSAEVKVTHPNGAVATGVILPLKGVTEITLDGSRETDRVEILATMTTGGSYRVYDELVPHLGL